MNALRPLAARCAAAAPLSRAAARAAPRRNMAGNMDVKKSAHVEEWNGMREITEFTFKFDTMTWVVLAGTAALCTVVYKGVTMELETSRSTCIAGRKEGEKPKYM